MKELIFELGKHKRPSWMKEYCQCPTPLLLNSQQLRIFISTRPEKFGNYYTSNTGYLDFSISNSKFKLINISKNPILNLGSKGSFDEHGLMVNSIYSTLDKIYMFYTGWNRKTTVPYSMSIGLAISSDRGLTFSKISDGPILSLNSYDPYFVTGPSVRRFQNKYYMWYSTATDWLHINGKAEPKYQISYATSEDLLNWIPSGKLCIPEISKGECQVSFAVFQDKKTSSYYSFFSYRDLYKYIKNKRSSSSYKIGLVKSNDLINWKRIENSYFLKTEFGSSYWDNEMACYPQFLDSLFKNDIRRILYCGNYFGKFAFGTKPLKKY